MKTSILGKVVKYAVIILIIAGLGTGGYFAYNKFIVKANAKNTSSENTTKVVRGDLAVTITGTGTVQPVSSYDIVSLVQGKILSASFAEGDSVKVGDLLYKIDSSDLSYNIQKAQDSVSKLQLSNQQTSDSVKDYTVFAPVSGHLSSFTLNVGDQVSSSGTIGTINNENKIKATFQFGKTQAEKIKVGDKARLAVSDLMQYVDGTVTNVNNAAAPNSYGAAVCNVDIAVDNPGGITSGLTVSGIVKTSSGDVECPDSGTTSYDVASRSVTAKTAGKVKEVFVQNNDWVTAGQKILTLDTSDINITVQKNDLELKDALISLDSQKKQLDNYNIMSPITGTVITKNYKEGDTIGTSSDSKTLMTVADVSKMKFTISVDELDIPNVAVGQKVKVTADALTNKTFEGEVTKVPLSGTTSNGVTTYSVEVTISNPGSLKPGMNVNSEVQVQSAKNVLYVPSAAVTKVDGKAYVYVKADNTASVSDGKQNAGSTAVPAQSTNQPSNQQGSQPNGLNKSGSNTSVKQKKEVEIGINNDSYIEIKSGLNEGDTVYLSTTSSSTTKTSTTKTQDQGGSSGGMMGAGGPPPN